MQVASQTKGVHIFQGSDDMSYDLLPSYRTRPIGSHTAGTLTVMRARRIISLLLACRDIQSELLLQQGP